MIKLWSVGTAVNSKMNHKKKKKFSSYMSNDSRGYIAIVVEVMGTFV